MYPTLWRWFAAIVLLMVTPAVVLVAPPPAMAQHAPRVGQPAPEITGAAWINSEPLSLEKLRGRVVFVEFWTYG
jgi:hypothetical protein